MSARANVVEEPVVAPRPNRRRRFVALEDIKDELIRAEVKRRDDLNELIRVNIAQADEIAGLRREVQRLLAQQVSTWQATSCIEHAKGFLDDAIRTLNSDRLSDP